MALEVSWCRRLLQGVDSWLLKHPETTSCAATAHANVKVGFMYRVNFKLNELNLLFCVRGLGCEFNGMLTEGT